MTSDGGGSSADNGGGGGKGNGGGARRFTLRHALWCVVVAGIVLRVITYRGGFLFWDAPYYLQMGRSFAEGGNFLLPWGDPFSPAGDGYVPGPSHHFSPLFPMYLGSLFAAFGYSLGLARAATIVLSVLVLAVVFWTTRDLMGSDKALVVTAVFALDPVMIMSTRDVMPEPLITMLFVLTIWAIVRAIGDDRYMVVAALCAAGGYLTKASVGYLFIVAGAGGFAWRFYYLRWDVFRRRYYMAAIVIFLAIVGAWSLRNVSAFGWPSWQTSPYLEEALGHALGHPSDFLVALAVTTPFFAALLLTYGAYWLPWLRRSLRRVREERTSALWLAVGLVLVITLWFSAALAIFEGSDLATHSAVRLRYLVLAFPPLLWAAMEEVDLASLDVALRPRGLAAMLGEAVTTLRSLGGRPRRALAFGMVLVMAVSLPLVGSEYLLVSGTLLGGALALLLRDPRKVLTVMLATFLLVGVELATEGVTVPEVALARDVSGLVGPGQTVAMDGGEVDIGYLYAGLETFDFEMVTYEEGSAPDLIISHHLEREYPGYRLVDVYDHGERPGLVKRLSLGLLPGSEAVETPTVALWQRS
jgi:4-amino-4-deoxy-L-arabinose transferase-like glycosyltransferase